MRWDERTRLLLGDANASLLAKAHVLVVGLGGVGSWVAEFLCRAGIGSLTIADGDVVEPSNRNRQLTALISTTGKAKSDVLALRMKDINPELRLTNINGFLRDTKTTEILDSDSFDYVVDCIDTLSPKTFLLYHAVTRGFRVVSSMGSGGKLDPSLIRVADISETYDCNLARMVRKRLHRLGIRTGIKTVFSPEKVPGQAIRPPVEDSTHSVVGTISYIPALFGGFIAAEVIRDLIKPTAGDLQ